MSTMISKNRKSIASLKAECADQLHIWERDKKLDNGTTKHVCFFTCGDMTGYVSPKALEKLRAGGKESDLQFAECSQEGSNKWIPCVMTKGNGAVETFTL